VPREQKQILRFVQDDKQGLPFPKPVQHPRLFCYNTLMRPTPYDYPAVLASFFEAASDVPPERLLPLRELVESAAKRALSHADIVYMPAFKILDFLSDITELAISIAAEPHLRTHESKAMLSQLLTDEAPAFAELYREAALERVRYEPVMLTDTYDSPLAKRNAILAIRLARMLAIYEESGLIQEAHLRLVREMAERAMSSPDFATYRAGPFCQFFAELLLEALRAESATDLLTAIGPQSRAWRSFKLKSQRFSADPDDPLITGASSEAIPLPNPTTHRLH
jgi:hypothetical protein